MIEHLALGGDGLGDLGGLLTGCTGYRHADRHTDINSTWGVGGRRVLLDH